MSRTAATTASVLALFLLLGGWLSYRYFVVVPRHIVVSDTSATSQPSPGKEFSLSDREIAEMGSYADSPRFRPVVVAYVQNLAKYKQLSFIEVSAQTDSQEIAATLSNV